MEISFYLVDVFAEQPLTGNPLALIPDADSLDERTMPEIARELRQAETTFLFPPRQPDAAWRLRSFTAGGVEVFGAGHNSLGAWWWLAESGLLKLSGGLNELTQEIGGSLLPVEVDVLGQKPKSVTLTQSAPVFGRTHSVLEPLAAALGLNSADLATELPVQAVSTGASHLMVPVRSREGIERARPDADPLTSILQAAGAEGCYLFSLDPVSSAAVAHARFFNPSVGLMEDSATGTAAGPLACQLVAHGICKEGEAIAIEQGHEMGRPSLLTVRVSGGIVKLSGRCMTVASGVLRI
jgi:trans-2,3-dihydro-3-hydroxyanthranilate isomerase